MSVPVGNRNEGKLGVLNEMHKTCVYTIDKCRNEKIFPKSSRWVIAKPIVDECLAALTCIRRANAVFVAPGHPEDYRYRRSEQVHAHSHLDALLTLVDVAYTSYSLPTSVIEFWTGMILHTDDMLKAWMKSDKERYKDESC